MSKGGEEGASTLSCTLLFRVIAHRTHRNAGAADGAADDGETRNGGRGLRPRQAQDGLEEALHGSALGI